jgi:4-amino-4-deoxy-L-arabinose transferase-like glycosyltransferase
LTGRAPVRSSLADRFADGVVVLGLLALAAALRLPNLATRAPFDADQGWIMLVLERWLRHGEIPLLGPPASIGGLHHGVLSIYLLGPAAALGDLDPTAVLGVIAAAGIATVGLVWYLARAVGGRIAGLVAGLCLALSATEVGRSTELWTPSLVPFGSALAAAAGWRAWRSRRPGWWLAAGLGAAIALQGHLLSAVAVAPLAGLAVADLRRAGTERRRTALAVLGGAAIVAASYAPLVVSELGSGFAEARALPAAAGAGTGERSLWTLFVVAVRVASTSLVGLVTAAPELAIAVTVALGFGTAWLALGGPTGQASEADREGRVWARRLAVRWLGGVVLVVVPALWLAAPALATVVEALPVDHYHAASDPLVVVLAGIVVGALVEQGRRSGASVMGSRPGLLAEPAGVRVLGIGALLAVAGLLAWNLARQPPAMAPGGAWPTVEAGARRVATAVPSGSVVLLRSLPDFTAPDAMTFALHAVGRAAVGPGDPSIPGDGGSPPTELPRPTEPPRAAAGVALVVVCDDRFRAVLGAACGGSAEAAWLGSATWTLVDRFGLGAHRYVSVYLPPGRG